MTKDDLDAIRKRNEDWLELGWDLNEDQQAVRSLLSEINRLQQLLHVADDVGNKAAAEVERLQSIIRGKTFVTDEPAPLTPGGAGSRSPQGEGTARPARHYEAGRLPIRVCYRTGETAVTKPVSEMTPSELAAELRARNDAQDDNFLLDLANRLEDESSAEPDMIPNQIFNCPHCGAPGQVKEGKAEYSCGCRWTSMQPQQLPVYPHPYYPAPFQNPFRWEKT